MSRIEESRRRVQERLHEIGEAAEREVARAHRLRDAAIAVLGVLGLMLATKRVAKAIAAKASTKKKRRDDDPLERGRAARRRR